jgi:hypothetical protein
MMDLTHAIPASKSASLIRVFFAAFGGAIYRLERLASNISKSLPEMRIFVPVVSDVIAGVFVAGAVRYKSGQAPQSLFGSLTCKMAPEGD